MGGPPDPVAEAFLKRLEISKRAQLIRARLSQHNPASRAPVAPPSAPDSSAAASSNTLASALRVEKREGKRKASSAALEDGIGSSQKEARSRSPSPVDGERKPTLWEVMLVPPAPQVHPASPRAALPQGLGYGYPSSSASSSSYHNYRGSPGPYDPYDAYHPHHPASPSFYASPDPNASSFSQPFTSQTHNTPSTSAVRGTTPGFGEGEGPSVPPASPRRTGVTDASLRVPSPGGPYPHPKGSFGRSPSSTFPRPPTTAAVANHSYAQGLTTSPIVNSSPKISSARTSIARPPASAPARTVLHPSPLGAPGPSVYPPGFQNAPHLPSRLQQHRARLGGLAPRSPGRDGPSSPAGPRGHRRTVSSTLSAVVNFQNAQRASPQSKGPVEEYMSQLQSPGRSPRKRRHSPPRSAPPIGKPANMADISAASALAAMLTSNGSVSSQRGSAEPSEPGSGRLQPARPVRTTTPPPEGRSKGGEGQEEDAAGMLMFFHHSPSPAKPRNTPRRDANTNGGPPPPASAARGRVLMFGDDEPASGGGFGSALKGKSTTTSLTGSAATRTTSASNGSPGMSPKKARLDEKKLKVEVVSGGESGKENHGTHAEGDPDSSSSSLFSQVEGGHPPTPNNTRALPVALSATDSVASSNPACSPTSTATELNPSSLPQFISPARTPPPDISYPAASNLPRESPSQAGVAFKNGLNPTLAPTSLPQTGATPSWPDFGFLVESRSTTGGTGVMSSPGRKQLQDDGAKERSPVVLSQQKLGGLA